MTGIGKICKVSDCCNVGKIVNGIGMCTGSEWLYDEVREKTEEWKDK